MAKGFTSRHHTKAGSPNRNRPRSSQPASQDTSVLRILPAPISAPDPLTFDDLIIAEAFEDSQARKNLWLHAAGFGVSA
jgi:hypothetical protein